MTKQDANEVAKKKLNCWEVKNCGRELAKKNIKDFEVCPVIQDSKYSNINNGINAGRICWTISGTFCNNKVQGTFAKKILSCLECDFFLQVSQEEKENFKMFIPENNQSEMMDFIVHLKAIYNQLKEKANELSCLFAISDIALNDISISNFLQKTVETIPSGWQYPKDTCARIIINNNTYKTSNFLETIWRQEANININSKNIGKIQVYYLQAKPPRGEGPFLKDEKKLINQIANKIADIILQKQIQEERKKTKKQMIQTEKLASIGKLTAGIGHEINNPLAIINGYSSIIEKKIKENGIFDSDLQDMFDDQRKSIKRITNIVNGLRSYSRIDSDSIEVIKINDVIKDTLSFLQVVYEKENIEIRVKYDMEPINIKANNGNFQQVLVNLLSNAKDATAEKKYPKIIIETEKIMDTVVLRVTDNGTGIQKDKIHRIFDVFYTSKSPGKGTGLGLNIIKNIIKQFHGTIEVDSEINKGTTFTITFPITDEFSIVTEKKNDKIEQHKLSGKVLVIDDEEQLRQLLAMQLHDYGMQVDEASNGQEGLKKINQCNYDYIFTDLKMPIMDGKQLITILKESKNFSGKIIIISGTVENDIENISVDGVLNKPFDENDIYHLIKNK